MKAIAFLALCTALLMAAPVHAGGPTMSIGVTDEGFRTESLTDARTRMTLARLVGADSVRVSTTWWPGETAPREPETTSLDSVAGAAQLTGLRVFMVVNHAGNWATPLTDEARQEYAAYTASVVRRYPIIRDVVVGNEPNINRFWLPQFNEDGSNAASPAYLALLGETYDAVKAVSRRIQVIGGALSPRGSDTYPSGRHTHSPTTFIRDLGTAFRASGRDRPVMDGFSIHPYQDNSSQSPTTRHGGSRTISISDYDKLVRLLSEAFDGTAQLGSALPIYYLEYGVESTVPAGKRGLYSEAEPTTTRPASPATQAAYYRLAMQIAYCQPTVKAFMLFLLRDEAALPRWQSGVYYVDGTPKPSAAVFRRSVREARRGILARCRGLKLTPRALRTSWPRGRLRGKPVTFGLSCSLDCAYRAEAVNVRGKVAAVARGQLVAGKLKRIAVRGKLPAGRYRLRVTLVAPLNPGKPRRLTSPPFTR